MTPSLPTSAGSSETSRLSSLKTSFSSCDHKVSEIEGQAVLLDAQIVDSASRRDEAGALQSNYEEARGALEVMEAAWRRRFEEKLASLISHGLTAVFGEETNVHIEASTKRGATSMTLKLEQGGVELGNIIDGTGGSIVSVLSVLLRVMLTISVRPPLRRLIVLDEPFSMVAPDHLPAIGSLLRELSERLGIQWIIVTHEAELSDAADAVFEVVKTDDTATVRQLKTHNEERV